jgi:hypothetical protein
VPRALTVFLTFVALAYAAYAAPASTPGKIPPELVGEWATAKSQFARDAIMTGSVVYLLADGTVAFIGAPPPIGIRGISVYDPAAHTLTVTLLDDEDGGRPRQTLVFTHDPRAKTLAVLLGKTAEVFNRRRDQVPDFILKDIEAAKSSTKRQR